MAVDDYLEANRRRWDRLTGEHEHAPFYDLPGFKAGRDRLRAIELRELGDGAGKSLLHLQCHFGLDTLAWARRGAIVTGVDFSPKAIALARALGDELEIPATFVCSDIDTLPEHLNGQFDIVFTSYGVLHGIPNIERWGAVIAHFVKPGGIFYIVEDHPMFRVFRPQPNERFEAVRQYFHRETPQRIEASGSYAAPDGEGDVSYIWDHSLGSIVNALLDSGLQLDFLHEFPFAARAKFDWMVQEEDGWWRLPDDQHGIIPFLFSLQAHKPRIGREKV